MVMDRQQRRVDLPVSKAWAVEIAQQHADDVVLAAALFKPNAAGNCELSWSGWKSRQIMKARGTYLGERVVLALTPIDVYAVELVFWGRVHRTIRRWARSDLFVSMVVTRGREPDPRWPALLIASRRGRLLAEVQALIRDNDAERVGGLLLAGNRALGDRSR
jgi:hypothetical protein